MDCDIGMNLANGCNSLGSLIEAIAEAMLDPVEFSKRTRAVNVVDVFEIQSLGAIEEVSKADRESRNQLRFEHLIVVQNRLPVLGLRERQTVIR